MKNITYFLQKLSFLDLKAYRQLFIQQEKKYLYKISFVITF